MSLALDHLADRNSVELVRLHSQYDFPPYVKEAEPQDVFDRTSDLPASSYADPVNRQFPCDTRERTWLSALYFTEKRASINEHHAEKIEKKLRGFADFWGIRRDLEKIAMRHEELQKAAEVVYGDSDYLWVFEGENGHKERHLRVSSPIEVKQAADYLFQHCDDFPFSERRVMADKLLQKSAQFGASLGDHREFVERQAGRGVCDPDEAIAMIRNRAGAVRDVSLKQKFAKIADTVERNKTEALMPEQAIKLAETLDQLDRTLGRTNYGPDYPRPEDVLFKATFSKVASGLQSSVGSPSGKIYDKQALASVPAEALRETFGDAFAARVAGPFGVDMEKMAAAVAALPIKDARILDDVLARHRIEPTLTKAAEADPEFLADRQKFFREMAKAY